MPYTAEPIAPDIISSMLNTQWDTNDSNIPEPTFFVPNNGLNPIRYDLYTGDYIIIKADSPALEESPIGVWIYGNRMTRVLLEVATRQSRQRLWDLMKEIRRIVHAQMHLLSQYQRIQFVNFQEIYDDTFRIWKGRVILELLNSSVLLETTT